MMDLAIIAGLGSAIAVTVYLLFGARMSAKQKKWRSAASDPAGNADKEVLDR